METKVTTGNLNITIKNSRPTITRSINFKTGDTASFTVTLQDDPTATVNDLHRKSVEYLIELLQEWITKP